MSKKQDATMIDFSQKICDLNGQPFEVAHREVYPATGAPVAGTGEPLTLLTVVTGSLSQIYQDEKTLTDDEKAKRGFLALQIYNATENVRLKVEDIALVKKMIAKRYSNTVIIARAWSMLDPAEVT